MLTKGDSLVVLRLDRLGRSLRDLANIAHEIEEVGAHLRVIEPSVDTATSAGRAFFGMLAVFAQFETWMQPDISDNPIYTGDLTKPLGTITAQAIIVPSTTDLLSSRRQGPPARTAPVGQQSRVVCRSHSVRCRA